MKMIKPNEDQNQRLIQNTNRDQNQKVTKGGDTFTNKPGEGIGTEVISPGEGGSDDISDGPTVLQSKPPLSWKALLYQKKWNQNKMILL
jgi:hypothetical protein